MRRITVPLFTLILLVVLGGGAPVSAAAQNNPGEPKQDAPKGDEAKAKKKVEAGPETRPKGKPFNGKLEAVDKVNKTITIKGKEKDRTFQITSNTRLTKDGQPAVLDAAVVGEEVAGTWRESADGKLEAMSIRFGAKAPGQAKPKKEKKEKEEK
jgi:hypothetical protein